MSEPVVFRKAVFLLPAHDETTSLRETVEGLEAVCKPEDVTRLIVVLAPRATPACRREADGLAAGERSIPLMIYQEKGGAMAKEVQQLLRAQSDATHAFIWTADQEAPTETAALMIEEARSHPAAVVQLSRFLPGGGLPESKKGFINFRDTAFARLTCLLYRSRQTDPYFSIALFPVCDFLRFDLREPFMALALEYHLCFERIGTQFIELPLKQQKRPEGTSNLKLKHKLRYLVPLIRIRFRPKHKLFKEDDAIEEA